MSTTTLQRAVAPLTPQTQQRALERPVDRKTAAGPLETNARPRTEPPIFIYIGYGEEHWRGQTCHVIGSAAPDERTIVFSCGCRASVPWWTLEPIATP